ncbi:MAG: histidine phosphatase family protein [Pseudomonadota bacterium]
MSILASRRAFLGMSSAGLLFPGSTLAQTELRNDLRRGGHVIYFRHGATTWSGIDQIDWPREQQRLLSDLGIRQSEQIGVAFRAEGIPVGEVLASPFARCRDMAEIAFGRVEERMELIGLLSDSAGRPARIRYLWDKLVSPPTAGSNRIIVSHRSNIAEVAGVSLAEGEAVLTRPAAQNFETRAQYMPEDWAQA